MQSKNLCMPWRYKQESCLLYFMKLLPSSHCSPLIPQSPPLNPSAQSLLSTPLLTTFLSFSFPTHSLLSSSSSYPPCRRSLCSLVFPSVPPTPTNPPPLSLPLILSPPPLGLCYRHHIGRLHTISGHVIIILFIYNARWSGDAVLHLVLPREGGRLE